MMEIAANLANKLWKGRSRLLIATSLVRSRARLCVAFFTLLCFLFIQSLVAAAALNWRAGCIAQFP